jgi:hypothetical protein
MNMLFILFLGIWCLCFVNLFLCEIILKRNSQVRDLRIKLLDEEAEWGIAQIRLGKLHTEKFKRYESLPSYNRMLYSIWVLVSKYEKDLKPIEEYYKE